MRFENLQFQPINASRYATPDLSLISEKIPSFRWWILNRRRLSATIAIEERRRARKGVKDGLGGAPRERERGRIYSIRDIYYTVIAVLRLWSHTSRGIELRPFIVSITMDGL